MMAETGSMENVTGNKIAVPVVGPNPGKTPTSIPMETPSKQYSRFDHVSAVSKPCNNCINESIESSYHPKAFTGSGTPRNM